MTEGKPKWNADGSYIPSIDPHTPAKHLILEKYIEDSKIEKWLYKRTIENWSNSQ